MSNLNKEPGFADFTEKECTKCHKFKSLSEFYKRKDRKCGYKSQCKECMKKDAKDRWVNNPECRELHRESSYKLSKVKRKERSIWIDDIKLKSKCTICNYCNSPIKLGFHHIDPNSKVQSISQMLGCYSDESIEAELKKCIVLCNHCHRQLHNDGQEYLKQLNEGD